MKKTIVSISFITCVIALYVSSTSCSRKKEEDLRGRWSLIDLASDSSKSKTFWTFSSDGNITFEFEPNTNSHLDTVIGKFELVTKLQYKRFINIKEPAGVAGMWRVEKQKADILVLVRTEKADQSKEGAYLRREFTK